MKLTIFNFQDVDHLELQAEKNSVIHISGKSGCGKSIVFEAIYWCLYGTVKDVEKRGTQGKKLYVCYEPYENLRIYRQRNPKVFTVTSGGRTYEGPLAQQKIVELLSADKDGWLASSYVHDVIQPHFILTLPPKERYHVLLRMSMRGEDAEPYVKKIQEKIKTVHEEYSQKKKAHEQALLEYERLCKRYNVTFDDVLTSEEHAYHETVLLKTTERSAELNKELVSARESESKLGLVSNSLLRLEKQRTALLKYSEEGLKVLEEKNRCWLEVTRLRQEEEKCVTKLQTLYAQRETCTGPGLLVEKEVTLERIAQVEVAEKNWQRNKTLAEELGVVYEKEAVNEAIEHCRVALDSQEKAGLYALTRKKLQERNLLLQSLPTEPTVELEVAKEKLVNLEKALVLLKEDWVKTRQTLHEKTVTQLQEQLKGIKESFCTQRKQIQEACASRLEKGRENYEQKRKELLAIQKEGEQTLERLSRARTVHTCPHCHGGLRYVNEKLEKSSDEPFEIARYVAAKQQLAETTNKLTLLEKEQDQSKARLREEEEKALSTLSRQESQKETEQREKLQKEEKASLAVAEERYEKQNQECEKEIQRYRGILQAWQTFVTKKEALARCNAEIESLPELTEDRTPSTRLLSVQEVAEMKKRLQKLPTILVVPEPTISSAVLRKILERNKLNKEIDVQEKALESIKEALAKIDARDLKAVTVSELETYRKNAQQRTVLESQIESYQRDLAAIERTRTVLDIEKELQTVKKEKTDSEKALLKSKRATILVRDYNALEESSDACEALYEQELNFERLLGVVQDAMVDSLTGIINATNAYLATVVRKLFDDPIEIRLSTEKELKSGHKKQEISLVVNYKGGIVHNFQKGISAGEKARINTILSLAFAQHCNSPLLILDEAVSLLDGLAAENLMALVRDERYGVPDRLVLLASQNCNSGLVDKSVQYESLKK